ncbi:CheR family methyltransferase [Lichenibacterium ramalinae]|uniref:Chemotaxis protein methyltransferase n=1 Tax=Lichenibacterium ramalinae TaxID=2316527 RepID=A0A4Q2RD25_9HYPH|nr:protein-glutamate O-methyltransferase [Lichenibacterium ramalinae]RYB03072.1 chemotaxis protein [Lichenibacterium ramalinae]
MSAALNVPRSKAEGSRTDSIVEGEFVFRAEDFRRIAAMLHADAGIFLPEAKSTLVYSRLVKRLRILGLESFRDYCAFLDEAGGADERQQMMAALTTNVTRFFREPHHFEHLRTTVLPPLLEAAKRGGRVRIWSAGCSKGHEPYSLAMTVLSLMPDAADRDVRILASDIDPNVVEEGRAGRYDRGALDGVPPAELKRFFRPDGGRGESGWFSATDDMRRLVAFRELNLMGQWPMAGQFDIIFCRNVVIYFDEATQAKIWERFSQKLLPGGTLCIGHSERLSGSAQSRFTNVGITIYRHAGGKGA